MADARKIDLAAQVGCTIAPVIAVSIIFFACGPGAHHLTIDLSAAYAKAVLLGLPDTRAGRRPLPLGSFG